jgi:hypothetical protein
MQVLNRGDIIIGGVTFNLKLVNDCTYYSEGTGTENKYAAPVLMMCIINWILHGTGHTKASWK